MKITTWSLKGGVGKTSIALNIALTCKYKIITNETYSLLTTFLNDKEILKLGMSEKIPAIPKDESIIFDMGGSVDKRVIDCLKQSDFLLIPTTANDIDIQGLISTILEVQEHIEHNKIIIVVNKTTTQKELAKVSEILKDIFKTNSSKFKIFEIKKSRGMINICNQKKSIKELVSEGGLNKQYYKDIDKQFNSLINAITTR